MAAPNVSRSFRAPLQRRELLNLFTQVLLGSAASSLSSTLHENRRQRHGRTKHERASRRCEHSTVGETRLRSVWVYRRPVARTLAGKAWCNNRAPANTPPGALTPILPSRKLARLLCAVRQPCYGKGHNRTSFFLIALHDLTIRETDATIHQPVLTSKLTI